MIQFLQFSYQSGVITRIYGITTSMKSINNPFIIALSNGFNDVANNLETLETIWDDV